MVLLLINDFTDKICTYLCFVVKITLLCSCILSKIQYISIYSPKPSSNDGYVPQVVGTMGYAAPEYVQTGRLRLKSDVWSYGVFLYELITGRRPIDRNRPKGEQKLLEWVKPYLSDAKKFHLILDPRLEGKQLSRSASKLAIIAGRCLVKNPRHRPNMSEVLEMVNRVVESSASASPLLPLKSLQPAEASHDSDVKNKKRIIDLKPGECNWFARMWRPKPLKTCS